MEACEDFRDDWLIGEFEQDIAWKKKAACGGTPIGLWFDKRPQEALKICNDYCTVSSECLEYALEWETKADWCAGVFGGKTAKQREKIIAQNKG